MRRAPLPLTKLTLTRGVSLRGCQHPQQRFLMLFPERTVDPERYPLGYVDIDTIENPDDYRQQWHAADLTEMLRRGHYLSGTKTVRTISRAYFETMAYMQQQNKANTYQEWLHHEAERFNVMGKILIRREFWEYSDFLDMETYQTDGVETYWVDNYRWNVDLHKEFMEYVQKIFPMAEHTHVSYYEYMTLLRYFKYHLRGQSFTPFLGKGIKLKPQWGVPIPGPISTQCFHLYHQWLEKFVGLYNIRRALVCNVGCGVLAYNTRRLVHMVRATDPNPNAIEGMMSDVKRMGNTYTRPEMSFRIGDIFPQKDDAVEYRDKHMYDMIVYQADANMLQTVSGELLDYAYAPQLKGHSGQLEKFFEQAAAYLRPRGVLVILTTNLTSLAYPDRPHPIELEIKSNRRWVLLDYFDRKLLGSLFTAHGDRMSGTGARVRLPPFLQPKARAELWVLHRLEDIEAFGWVHKLPGTKPPEDVKAKWGKSDLAQHRMKLMSQRASELGMEFGEYRDRMLKSIQNCEEPEDEVAQTIRMTFDPQYVQEVARKSKEYIEAKLNNERSFHRQVMMEHPPSAPSPRQVFEKEAARIREKLEAGAQPSRPLFGTSSTATSDDYQIQHQPERARQRLEKLIAERQQHMHASKAEALRSASTPLDRSE